MRLLFFLWIFLLAGCTASTIKQPAYPSKKLQGIFGIVSQNTATSGHFTWIQNDEYFTIELYGPLGLGATTLTEKAGVDTLRTAEGKIYQANSPESLLQQVLNWSMPVAGLKYWLWAQAEPGILFNAAYDQQNRMISLNQQGWNISYTYPNNTVHPQRIVLIQPPVKVTLIINQAVTN